MAPLVIGLAASLTAPALAADSTRSSSERSMRGSPQVVLDRLTFPTAESHDRYASYLRRVLGKEAQRADWGAGKSSRIEYRFAVETLELTRRGKVLEVRCSALGRLPKGKSARGTLRYGGDPKRSTQLVHGVLEIVARGVITRLAELERIRRGQLRPARVRPPS